jgi:hypothetical protein
MAHARSVAATAPTSTIASGEPTPGMVTVASMPGTVTSYVDAIRAATYAATPKKAAWPNESSLT